MFVTFFAFVALGMALALSAFSVGGLGLVLVGLASILAMVGSALSITSRAERPQRA